MRKLIHATIALCICFAILLGFSIYKQNSLEWPCAFMLFLSLITLCVFQNRNSQQLKEFAYKDGLTGLLNRSAYEEATGALNKRIRSQRNSKIGVIMFDVNGLKAVNDTLGHRVGDIYISEASRLIQEVYAGAEVYRFGGDEFVAIIKGNAIGKITEYESLFLHRLKEFNMSCDAFLSGMSIAVGSAVYDRGVDSAFSDTFARADKLMYENKRLQKNKN